MNNTLTQQLTELNRSISKVLGDDNTETNIDRLLIDMVRDRVKRGELSSLVKRNYDAISKVLSYLLNIPINTSDLKKSDLITSYNNKNINTKEYVQTRILHKAIDKYVKSKILGIYSMVGSEDEKSFRRYSINWDDPEQIEIMDWLDMEEKYGRIGHRSFEGLQTDT